MAEENKKEELNTERADERYCITLKKPYLFEGKSYDEIDLTGLLNVRTGDMIEVNRMMIRNGNSDIYQEHSLEYAVYLAARATGKPIEFFEMLPPYAGMQLKNKVTGFLYRQE